MREGLLTVLLAFTFSLAVACDGMAVLPRPVSTLADSGDYSTTTDSISSSCTVYRPSSLGEDHPIVVWGNGTGSTPLAYASFLRHIAGHGFVVAAANTTNAGSGEDMINCLDEVLEEYADNVNPDRIGTSGHSQGGSGAIMARADPRVVTSAPMQPAWLGLGLDAHTQGKQNGPMFLMSGSKDTVVDPEWHQGRIFSNAAVPVFWGTLQGATHFEPANNAGGFRGPATAWFLYQLMGDEEAAKLFVGDDCVLCTRSDWRVQKNDKDFF